MKLVKSLLLGSAAGIVAVGSAVAADLPVRKAAPVDYVQVCSAFGTGYFYIPGTDTCLKIGGYVRYEARFDDTKWSAPSLDGFAWGGAAYAPAGVTARSAGRGDTAFSQFARGQVNFDARTATEFGTLRSYIAINAESGGTSLYHGYIQFAGLTAGRHSSFFRGIGSPSLRGGMWMAERPNELIAYTVDGGPFSLTLSAESASANLAGNSNVFLNEDGEAAGWNLQNGSNGLPDFVASMRYSDAGWTLTGAAAISQLRFGFDSPNVNPAEDIDVSSIPGTTYGYALTAGLQYQFLPTTSFGIQGAYAKGASTYTNIGTAGLRYTVPVRDAYRMASGSVSLTESWVVNARVDHKWTPSISQSVYGAYGEYKAPAAVRYADALGDGSNVTGSGMPNSFTTWGLGSVVSWAPVSGLAVAGEVNYTQTTAKNRILINPDIDKTIKKDENWTATVRIQRSF